MRIGTIAEPQTTLSFFSVRTVAFETVIAQNRTNITIKIDYSNAGRLGLSG